MFTKIRNAMLALAAVATLGVGTLVATYRSGRCAASAAAAAVRRAAASAAECATSAAARVLAGVISAARPSWHIGHRIRIGHHRPHFRPHWCHSLAYHCRVHVRWPRPVYVGAPAIAATSYAVAPAVARPCTCLTKEYTPDNLVVFKDVCTKEVASAPVGNTQVQLPVPQQADPAQPQVR